MILRAIFAGLYATSVMLLLIGCWLFFDLPYHNGIGIFLCIAWTVICFSANRWLHIFYLSVRRVRKTILEEEEWLHPLMHELSLRSRIEPVPELLIIESPDLDAFAIGRNTIVLSRGLLVKLSEPEIKAVLAHEFGHLKDRDTLADTVFTMADWLPLKLVELGNTVLPFHKSTGLKKVGWYRKLALLAFIVLLFMASPDLPILIVFLILLKFVLPHLRRLIWICWCLFSRLQEYRQDHFAQSLGCGKHLKSALLKIDALNSDNLVSRLRHLSQTHPFLYMRIRRIEWLDGLRETP